MIEKAVILLYVCFTHVKSLPNTSGENYYWRDYNGIVPLDAFQAGKDSNGRPFYIGQGHFGQTGILPGTLVAGSTTLTVTASLSLHVATKYVKILCSPNPFLFRWIPTVNDKFYSLSDKCHFVMGGTESDKDIFIGRTMHEGNLYAGKIFLYGPPEHPELCLPKSSYNYETRYNSYEVLTFNCLEESTTCSRNDQPPRLLTYNAFIDCRHSTNK